MRREVAALSSAQSMCTEFKSTIKYVPNELLHCHKLTGSLIRKIKCKAWQLTMECTTRNPLKLTPAMGYEPSLIWRYWELTCNECTHLQRFLFPLKYSPLAHLDDVIIIKHISGTHLLTGSLILCPTASYSLNSYYWECFKFVICSFVRKLRIRCLPNAYAS